MATKRMGRYRLIIEGDLPVSFPLDGQLEVTWTVDGLPETGSEVVSVSSGIPGGSVTISQIITAAKALVVAELEDQGTGGHTVEEG